MKQRQQVLDALAAGPATSREIADRTGLPLKHCSAYLGDAHRVGQVSRVSARSLAGITGHPSFRYTLVPQG